MPQKPKGWRGEPGRHAAAARGIKTVRKLGKGFWVSPVEDMERELRAGKRRPKAVIGDYLALAEDAVGEMKLARERPDEFGPKISKRELNRMQQIVKELRRMYKEV